MDHTVSTRTVSELYFEELCASRRIAFERIPESNERTADYRVFPDSIVLIAEVKQLDPSNQDRQRQDVWATSDSDGAVAPSDRVQGLISDGYPQIKQAADGELPAMIVIYNNSGEWNWIDMFTVAKAMFGNYGIVLQLMPGQTMDEVGRGYLGQRKVTRGTMRSLSAVGVLERRSKSGALKFICYHNSFAKTPIDPRSLMDLADEQYAHPNPHDRGFVPWEFERIET